MMACQKFGNSVRKIVGYEKGSVDVRRLEDARRIVAVIYEGEVMVMLEGREHYMKGVFG